MSDRELATQAEAALKATTISYSDWKQRVDQGKYADVKKTKWWQAFDLLGQIDPVAPPPPAGAFGNLIPQPAFTITGTPMVCRTWSELQTVLAKAGSSRVIRIEGLIPVPVNVTVGLPDTRVFGLDRAKDGIVGGRFLINTDRVHLDTLRIRDSQYDGVKLADGKPAADVVLDNLWISDVGDQGILSGFSGSTRIWVRDCRIERVGLTPYPGVADGHCIYTGGPTSHWTILGNDLRPKAFAVQLYPNPTDVLVSQNTMFGGDSRGGLVAYTAKRVRVVGNIIARSKTGAFEIGNSVTESTVDDCMVWECPQGVWTDGYAQLPGSNVAIVDPMFVDEAAGDLRLKPGSPARGFVRSSQWGYVRSATAGCYA